MEYFLNGFSVALQPINLLYCFLGVFWGTLVGVLPGIGPTAGIALLLPATFHLSPVSGIIMLAGIYYGTMYGGSTTSILLNIPGEAASVVTALDGYKMARQGRAGPALGIAAFGSFIAGTFSVVLLSLMAPLLSKLALKFGPPEYFSLMILGMTLITYLSSGPLSKTLIMAVLGAVIGSVGIDMVTGEERFTFGIQELQDGVGLVPIVMGLFGISEVVTNAENILVQEIFKGKIKGLLPTLQDWSDSKWAIIRGSVLGFPIGVIPGGGGVIASFVSYAMEKKFSKNPEKFGNGAIEGVAGPESANNAATGGAFIPLLTLGIPSNVVMALLLGAFLIHGIQPGPLLIGKHPDIFWGLISSMYIGNIMLLILNLPLIGLWVKILKIPNKILLPLILLFCFIGAYSVNNSLFDVQIMLIFGVLGYIGRKFGYEPAPLILAYVLVTILENSFRQSLVLSSGSLSIFFIRPISAGCLLISLLFLLSVFVPAIGRKRKS